ncbi:MULTISPECIES: hypothetical protein [unclassified Variovorax]|uniref:hypothetical protein n=1 Tax=unclassified Variovorax TaxID=663243 RepID=UPI0006F4A3C8|nr:MULTISPECIES: hypothetical protein [unclassified Variovorax]KQW57610.1 hypothetical protein ASC92_15440 [Variovorax sp. Root411]KQX29551.1 hypothetical protein ASD05_05225 [Variovorax sp. Root434]
MRDWLYQLTGKAWLALVFGIGILGWAGYAQFKAGSDTHGAAVEDLVARSGKIVSGSEVTETTKRRRGGSTTRHYFVLDAKVADGSTEKWRVDYAIGRSKLEPLIDESVEVRIDPSDNNLVYEVKLKGQPVVKLADVQKIMESKDQAAASSATDKGTLIAGAVALLLGIGGLLIRRRIGDGYQAEQAAAVQTPVIGEKV